MANKKALVDMLSRNRLFDGFAKKDIAAIINSATEVVHPEGKVIVIEERPGVGFHLLLEGTAAVSVKGRKLRTLGPGDSFGDIAVIDGGPRVTLSLAPWDFRPLVLAHPQLAYKLLLKLCALLREAEKRPPV